MSASRAARVLGGSVAATALTGVAVSEYMRRNFGEDALSRTLTGYKVAVPAFFAYKRVQLFHDVLPRKLGRPVDAADLEARYEALHKVWAPPMLEAILTLRGFYLKTGQMVTTP